MKMKRKLGFDLLQIWFKMKKKCFCVSFSLFLLIIVFPQLIVFVFYNLTLEQIENVIKQE